MTSSDGNSHRDRTFPGSTSLRPTLSPKSIELLRDVENTHTSSLLWSLSLWLSKSSFQTPKSHGQSLTRSSSTLGLGPRDKRYRRRSLGVVPRLLSRWSRLCQRLVGRSPLSLYPLQFCRVLVVSPSLVPPFEISPYTLPSTLPPSLTDEDK